MVAHLAAVSDEQTLVDLGSDRLRALCRSIGFDDRPAVALFERMVAPWGYRSRSLPPSWPSEVGDDHTPFEFSLAIGASPELRVMVEPLGEAPSLPSNAAASMALLESLSNDFDVDLERLRRIADLFLPAIPRGTFALWVAAEFGAARTPHFKAYLNPFAQGNDLAPALIEEALMRLGFTNTWPFIARVLTKRGHDLDELMYLSLDLSRSGQARVKVYARHRRCTVAELEATAAGSPSYQAGDVTRFLNTVAPDRAVFNGRAPFTCYAFVEESAQRPAAVTTHFPINGYAKNDDIVHSRVLTYLEQVGLPTDAYRAALASLANRPLDAGIGIQSYVSIRRHHEKPRLTVYLPVEAYRPGTVAKPPRTEPPSGVREAVGRLEQASVDCDPFLRRFRREPFNAHHLVRLVAHLEIGLPATFAECANGLASRTDDDEVRTLLRARARREGPSDSLPRVPLIDLSAALGASNDLALTDDDSSASAPRFAAAFSDLLGSAVAYEAIGALTAAELFDRQMFRFVDYQLRRDRQATTTSALVSARLRLAEARGDDSIVLARNVPDEQLDHAWRGARAFWRAARAFLGDVYHLCYASAR